MFICKIQCIMKQVAKRTKFPMEKVPVAIDKCANTSSVSIPTAFVTRYGAETGKKLKTISCGFGVGLSWGVIKTDISSDDILPLVQTDDYYDDGFEDEA